MGEISVILILALIFIGPKKLPELASGLGKLIREIRKTTSDVKNEIQLDDSIRKPFEELREAVTLHPEELKRRDRLRKEMADIQKRAQESIDTATAQGLGEAEGDPTAATMAEPVEGSGEGSTPDGEGAPYAVDNAVQSSHLTDSAAAAALDEAASGATAEGSGRASAVISADPLAGSVTPAPVAATAHAVPGAAPAGTVAREPSAGNSTPPAPPAPPLAAVLAKGAGPERKPVLPPSGSDFLRSLRAVPESRKPLPGRPAPAPAQPLGAADRANTTQTLTEADLAAITVGPPPPPPPGQTGRTAVPPAPPARLPGATPPKTSNH